MSEQLDEVKATGENSEANDPVTPAGGKAKNRKADLKKSANPKADDNGDEAMTPNGTPDKKAPARLADKGTVKESVDAMFEGQDLSEEFMEKVSVVFESAVNEHLASETARLDEEYETRLVEETETVVKTISEKVDTYLDYVVDTWMEENEIAIEKGIKSEMAESFLQGMLDLFTEHNVQVDEDKVDVVAEMSEQLEEMKKQLDESMNTQIALKKQLDESKIQDAFEEISEGLAETQIDKFKSLTEGLEYGSVEEFTKKAEIIKENYFGDKSPKQELSEGLDEVDTLEESVDEVKLDPQMQKYLGAVSRNFRK